MSAWVPRCATCGAASPAPAFDPVDVRCGACGHADRVALPADGSVRTPILGAKALLGSRRWLEALAGRHTAQVTIVAACARCEAPLPLPWATPLSLRCQYCHGETSVPLGGNVIDLLPSARIDASTWGGGMSLSWTPEHRMGGTDEPMACPTCGAPVPAFEGSTACSHCQTPLFGLTACGKRFLPGVRIRGFDEGQNVDRWMALTDAIEHYLKRRAVRTESRKTTAGAFALWLLMIPAFLISACLAFGAAAYFAEDLGPGGLMAVVLCVGLAPVIAFAAIIFWAIRRGQRKRAEILRDG